MAETRDSADLVTRLIGGAAPHEPLEERALVAEMEKRLFGRGTQPVTLHRYVVLDRLGTGGTGAVYRGYDPELDRKVAIKLLHVRHDDPQRAREARARLLREAQAIAQLSHPNVVAVYDVGTYADHESAGLRERSAGTARPDPEGVFMVMEFVDGMDVAQWLGVRRRGWREVLDVFLAAGRGLAAAHDAGLVHRDFKPANVLLGADGRVRVLDFGLARAAGPASGQDPDPTPPEPQDQTEDPTTGSALEHPLTRLGTVMGTPAYMAPEQHRGDPADARADQFAFCVALYDAIYGGLPFRGDTIDALHRAKRRADIVRPERARDAPTWVHPVIERGLQPDPARRYPDMGTLLAALEHGGRVRRRWALTAGVGIVASLGLAGAFIMGKARTSCGERARAQLAGAWDGEVRNAVKDALLRSGATGSDRGWTSVERGLDAYAQTWTTTREAVCRANAAGDEGSASTARQLLCLDRSLSRLRELTLLLSEADADLALRAVDAVAGLPPLEVCQATSPRPSPEMSGSREELATLDRDLARAEALGAIGRFDEGLAPAQRALAAARALPHPPSEARALVVLAGLREYTSPRREQEDAWYAALQAAERAGDDDSAIQSWLGLARVVALNPGRLDEALRHAAMASARVDRAGSPDGLRADCLSMRGSIEKERGHYGRARELLEQALALGRRTYGDRHPAVANTYNSLGNMFADMDESAAALENYRRAMEIRREVFGEEHPRVAGVLNNIALLHNAAGENDEALAGLQITLAMERRAYGEDDARTVRTLNNIGTIFTSLGRFDEALDAHREALAIRLREYGPDHPEVAVSHTNLGVAYLRKLDLRAAEEHIRAALAIEERAMAPDHPDISNDLSNLALVLAHQDRIAEARPLLERALENCERAYGPTHRECALDRSLMADLEDDPRAALGHVDRARRDIVAAVGERHPDAALVFHRRASVLERLARHDEAASELELAIDALEAKLGPDHPNLTLPLIDLTRMRLGNEPSPVALARLERASSIEGGLDRPIVRGRLAFVRAQAAEATDATGALDEAREAMQLLERGDAPKKERDAVSEWLRRRAVRGEPRRDQAGMPQ